MAAPILSNEDSPESFLADMLDAGDYINNDKLARIVAEGAAEAAETLENLGHLFIRDASGRATGSPIRRGAHSYPRSLLSGPAQGTGIGRVLREALARSDVVVLEDYIVSRILVSTGRVAGVVALDYLTGSPVFLAAETVVVATGGAGWLFYPHTDVVRTATGDGYALAFHTGAELVDMEQVQFLPFALTHPAPIVGVRCGEASMTGPRARLLNAQGKLILEGLNVRSRAKLAMAMALEMHRGNVTEHGGLILDLSANLECEEGRKVYEERRRLGLLDPIRKAYGLKAYRWEEPLDVAPTAHFQMGGIRADQWGRSTVPGLLAAGEAMGGVHGGNRLAATAFSEAFVFGLRVGKLAGDSRISEEISSEVITEAEEEILRLNSLFGLCGRNRPVQLHRRLQKIMWGKVGLGRTAEGLQEALQEISALEAEIGDIRTSSIQKCNGEVRDGVELLMMLTTAKAITVSALTRCETRGAHIRIDYPEADDTNWLGNIVVRNEGGKMRARLEQKLVETVKERG
jgi:succinate dehydrogenase/fumarate reductase flavoprotein subunit